MLVDSNPFADWTYPVAIKLPPVTLPDALTTPVTYSPVGAHTTTLPTPLTPTVTLPPELTTLTFDVPLLMLVPLPLPVEVKVIVLLTVLPAILIPEPAAKFTTDALPDAVRTFPPALMLVK